MAHICWIATLVGVASLIFVQSIMNGFNRSIRSKLLAAEPHIRVLGDVGAAKIKDRFSEFEIETADAFVEQDVLIRTLDGRFSGAQARAYQQKGLTSYLARLYRHQFNLKSNEPVDERASGFDTKDIAIGVDLARELRLFEGDEVILFAPETLLLPAGETPPFERVRIRMLLASDIPDIDSKLILYRNGQVPLRFQTDRSSVQGIEFRLGNADHAEALKKAILHEPIEGVGSVETWGDRNEALFFALRMEKLAMMLFLALTVLITCFSLVTVLTMLISQKQKEIGLLMSVGLSLGRTRNLFLGVGGVLSGLGLTLGLFLGIGASLLLEKFPFDILPEIYYDRSLPSDLSWATVAIAAVGLSLIAFLFAYLPVRLYVHRSPAKNLRPQTET